MFIIQLLSLSFTAKFSEFIFSITDTLDLFLRISLYCFCFYAEVLEPQKL